MADISASSGKTSKTHDAIDYNIEIAQGKGFRTHLGASLIGRDCARQLWYVFRWAYQVRHSARILRLFDRGNREEERFTGWLRRAGVHVQDVDPTTGEQWRVIDHNGHFGGSLDAILYDAPDFPGVEILGEYKTHSDKSFKEIVKKGVQKAKREHYVQMQIYLLKKKLPAALYIAINKNDDDLYTEVVYFDEVVANQYLDRAGKIIDAPVPPDKISETSAWWGCTFCDYKKVCHFGEPMRISCRTCTHVRPVEDGGWLCTRFNYLLSESEQHRACRDHSPIPQ